MDGDSKKTLHSTMFLLIPVAIKDNDVTNFFTFHNVSINTICCSVNSVSLIIFTFHNVSINTHHKLSRIKQRKFFTFHNVSINTLVPGISICRDYPFTFHNVSINTVFHHLSLLPSEALHSTMFLLIQKSFLPIIFFKVSLHSTMFLLIPPYSLLPYNTIIILSLSVDFVILLIFLLHKNRKRSSCKAFY